MPDDAVVLDLMDDLIGGAVRQIGQKYRIAQVVFAQDFARDLTRTGVKFGTRWLGLDAKAHDEPPIADLPVLLPRGNGYGLHFDLADGDMGLAIACDGPVRGCFEDGGVVTPQFPQGHDWGCAVIIPGGRVSSSVPGLSTPPPNAAGTMLVGAEDGTASVVFARAAGPTPAELGTVTIKAAGPTASIKAGSDTSALPVAVEAAVLANLAALNQMIQTLPAVPGDPGIIAALKTGFGTWFAALQDMADAKLVVDGPAP